MKMDERVKKASHGIIGLERWNYCWVDVIPCSYLWDDWEALYGSDDGVLMFMKESSRLHIYIGSVVGRGLAVLLQSSELCEQMYSIRYRIDDLILLLNTTDYSIQPPCIICSASCYELIVP